jgi:hypothetical protein
MLAVLALIQETPTPDHSLPPEAPSAPAPTLTKPQSRSATPDDGECAHRTRRSRVEHASSTRRSRARTG